ncbi:globin domain-containing protein [Candidatus Methylacidithermus pantelleriae]|uniref:Hemoglobin-like flavoprotein fused to Roadblock/LC7 domain n=1 Tax=Candidatus Methylacidithermus pantelleriae TaxID=2744239 RepID=A0A8J2FQG2_9BACT|nr:globin domain-containing protein [Candidatus Methylacidithermus pantelleriae]CAF0698656.1 Hemoglobin-like flavoprotein fused to Roadblock/LC7 domain [Candidatus Methylacidithermus pantelleriae]
MVPEDIKLIQRSWIKVVERSNEAGRLFYKRLFEVRPEVRSLFKREIEEQGRKLMDVLNWVVVNLPDTSAVLEAARALARRHVDYGVQEEHYELVGKTLLWTLRSVIGAEWTPEVEEAWSRAYDVLAQTMVEEHRKVTSGRHVEQELFQILSSVASGQPGIVGAAVATEDGLTVVYTGSQNRSDQLSLAVTTMRALGKKMCASFEAGTVQEISVTGRELQLFVRAAGPKAAVGMAFPSGASEGLAHLLTRIAAEKVEKILGRLP